MLLLDTCSRLRRFSDYRASKIIKWIKLTCFLSYSLSHLLGTIVFISHGSCLWPSNWYPLELLEQCDGRRSRLLNTVKVPFSACTELLLVDPQAHDLFRSLFISFVRSSPDGDGLSWLCISQSKLDRRLNKEVAPMLFLRNLSCASVVFRRSISTSVILR